jgi:hypothetical protein
MYHTGNGGKNSFVIYMVNVNVKIWAEIAPPQGKENNMDSKTDCILPSLNFIILLPLMSRKLLTY